MLPTKAELDRAELELEPLSFVTERGVLVTTHLASDPDQPAVQIAYKTYSPPPERADTKSPTVLFIPGEYQSGALYDEAAQALAERGVVAAALSLGGHGVGRWYSHDVWQAKDLTIERYRYHARLVIQALPVASRRLILAGGGVLGSLLVQQLAHEMTLAGMVLLGGCLPHLAAATLTINRPAWRWRRRRQPKALDALVWPPNQEMIRARWLGYEVPDQVVFAVWQQLRSESPWVQRTYQLLADQPLPPILSMPALVIVGSEDALLTPAVRTRTAQAYHRPLVTIPGAPHLLVLSAQRLLVIERLAAFCQAAAPALSW